MPYYLTNIDVLGFKAVIGKIAMACTTAPTLAAGVTKIGLRRSTSVVTCICKQKLTLVFKTLNHIKYHNALRSLKLEAFSSLVKIAAKPLQTAV